jgi:hypothetical protein
MRLSSAALWFVVPLAFLGAEGLKPGDRVIVEEVDGLQQGLMVEPKVVEMPRQK